MGLIASIFDSLQQQVLPQVTVVTYYLQTFLRIVATLSAIGWISAFLYASFYYYYVPVVEQERPVHFQFRVCDSGVGMCSFPTANISLSKDGENQVFKVGQPYKIIVDLHVPESDSNRNIGMFMLVMKLYNKHGVVVKTSGRASTLHYKSELLRTLETLVFAPMFLFGYIEQKQFLHVELFPEYTDSAFNPSVGLTIEVESFKVEIYQAVLRVFAQFSGIKYFLYYWPITSMVIGIATNFVTISSAVLIFWYQFRFPWKQDENNPVVRVNLSRNRKRESPVKQKRDTGASGGRLALETLGSHDSSDTEQPRDPEETSLLSTGVRTQHDTHTPGVRQRLSRPADVT
ncbi:seipin-like isoform X2 [Mya arenaria]|uniref:seipin-like isoform X2 n=1 Tax=Mya arenaria TaxID=6604 RepID=UPI0022E4C59B|nr:seipin-like isoform X2 [Mya arenaria]